MPISSKNNRDCTRRIIVVRAIREEGSTLLGRLNYIKQEDGSRRFHTAILRLEENEYGSSSFRLIEDLNPAEMNEALSLSLLLFEAAQEEMWLRDSLETIHVR